MLSYISILFLWLAFASTASAQRVDVKIYGAEDTELELEFRWLGEKVAVPLKQIEDAYSGAAQGDDIRFLPIRLWVTSDKRPVSTLVFDGVVPVYLDDQVVYIHLGTGQTEARLQSGPGIQSQRQWVESSQTGLFALGFMVVFAVVLWVSRSPRGPPIEIRWPFWLSPLVFLIISMLLTWPAIGSGTEYFVGRHHDAPGTIWFLWSSVNWEGFWDPNTAWPVGGSYERLDSYLLYFLAQLGSWVNPAALHGWLLVFGMALSAWSMEYFARVAGAVAPWSIFAGVCFIGGGVAATVALEGHVYHLLNPWMPLFAAFWWQACKSSGTRRQALFSGFFFVLCLLTSAYIGLSCAIIALVFWLGHRGWKIKHTLYALIPVVPIVLIYSLSFFGASGNSLEGDPMAVAVSSATLENMLGASSDIDRASHSLSVGLLPLCLGLSFLLPSISSSRSGYRVLIALVIVGLICSMGTHFFLNSSAGILPLPLLLLRKLPGLDMLDFPLRLSWCVFLALGVMGALAASRLAEKGNRRLHWLWVVLFLEPLLLTRLPFRQQSQSNEVPSVLMTVEGPILSLYPESLEFGYEYDPELYFTAMSCLFQAQHHQPIADDCISVDVSSQPRAVLGRWVHNRLMAGQSHVVHSALGELGFVGLVFHPDLYSDGDSIRLQSALSLIYKTPEESKDGGLWTQLYRIQSEGKRPQNWESLAEIPIKQWGAQSEIATMDRLLVGLISEDSDVKYKLRVGQDGLDLGAVPFRDLQLGAGQAITDGRLYAEWTVPTSNELLLKVEGPDQSILWEGNFRPASNMEYLFIKLPDGPVPLVPTVISPPLNPMGGLFALIGWTGILGFGLFMFGANRKWKVDVE